MNAALLVNLIVVLLQSILQAAQVGGVAPDIIANIEAALANLLKVHGTPVTYEQLEKLRVTTQW